MYNGDAIEPSIGRILWPRRPKRRYGYSTTEGGYTSLIPNAGSKVEAG